MTKNEHTSGFTLIEMSIVLVIIGLIVGAIFVGQDIINAAQIRATVGQVEKYKSAVNTFRTKYNDIPGDMLIAKSTQFGLYSSVTLAGTAGNQDGNGLIEGGAANSTNAMGETLIFWEHLGQANLMDGQFGIAGNSIIVNTTGKVTNTVINLRQSLPPTRTTPPSYFTVYAASGQNYYQIVPLATIPTSGVYTFGTVGLTPIQAYSMDLKLDDGLPQTGSVQSVAISGGLNQSPTFNATSTNNTCDLGNLSATDTYNVTLTTGGMDGSCSLRFAF